MHADEPEEKLEATTGFEPVMGVLQVSPERPSPSSSVQTTIEIRTVIPRTSAPVRSRLLRLLSPKSRVFPNVVPVARKASLYQLDS